MENLEKLHKKVNDLVSQYEKLRQEKIATEEACAVLQDQVKALEGQVKTLQEENRRLEKSLNEKNDIALKRISRLVDKIDQFQTEMKISWQKYLNPLRLF